MNKRKLIDCISILYVLFNFANYLTILSVNKIALSVNVIGNVCGWMSISADDASSVVSDKV